MNMETKKGNLFDSLPEDRIFKQKLPLKYEYDPEYEEFVGREEKMRQLGSKLNPILQGKSGSVAFVTGLTGNGKTTTVKISLQQLEQKMEEQERELVTSYIEECSSQLQVLRDISDSLGIDFDGTETDRHISKIKQRIKKNDTAYIVALDDINTLFKDGKSDDPGNQLLKTLYEARVDILNNSDGDLVIIGVTNNSNFTSQFNSMVKSRYTQDTIRFPSYNATQLRKILEIRADKAFRGGVPDPNSNENGALKTGVIEKIAAKVASGEGDARKAIRVLRKVGEMAVDRELAKIRKNLVDEAIDEVEKKHAVNEFKNLPVQPRIVYYAIINDNLGALKTNRVYKKYKTECNEIDVSKVSKKRVTDFLKDLENAGFVDIGSKTLKHGGRTNTYKSLYDEELEEELMEWFEEEYKSEEEF